MIKLIADSTCDLSKDIIEKYDIGIAPLTINIEGKIYKDKVEIQPDEFYEIIDSLKENTTTSMPSPTEYMGLFDEAVKKGYDKILCICMSSGTSGAFQSAVIAKDLYFEEHPESSIQIYVVDSRSMSHGSGWLILKSARMRENGATYEDLITFNETYKTSVKHYLSVDDLSNLIRSGRLSNTSALVGKLLMVKPIMSMKNGKGAIVAKERGRKRVLKHYVTEYLERVNDEVTDFIIIGYTSDINVAENLKNMLIGQGVDKEIFIMQMGVSVGNHVGLGGLSMFFVEKRENHDNVYLKAMKEFVHKGNDMMHHKRDELMKKMTDFLKER